MGLGGGDKLARGHKTAQFSAGSAKQGDKVQINKGIIGTEADWAAAEKAKIKDTVAPEEPKLKSKVRPLFDRVLIRKSEELDRSKGGILIPEGAKDRPSEGTVLYVGRGHKLEDGSWQPLEVQIGEKVIFGRYAGVECRIDGEVVLLMRESEILAVLEPGN